MTEKEYIEQLEKENMELVHNINVMSQELGEAKDIIKALTKHINSDDTMDTRHGHTDGVTTAKKNLNKSTQN